jgi:hypothetical protein
MMISSLLLLFFLQAPSGPTVIVGLDDGRQLIVENPEFSGFIEGRNADAVLMYRQANFHGEMPMRSISRIEFGTYRNGKPFLMTVTLRTGQKLEVESERRDFVTLKGRTTFGNVTINHPDPVSGPLRFNTKRTTNRKDDLTIQYLEFPGS